MNNDIKAQSHQLYMDDRKIIIYMYMYSAWELLVYMYKNIVLHVHYIYVHVHERHVYKCMS